MNWRVGGYLVGWLVGWFNSQLVNLGASDSRDPEPPAEGQPDFNEVTVQVQHDVSQSPVMLQA